jgi:hypothetical protein
VIIHIHNINSILQSPQPMQALVDALITFDVAPFVLQRHNTHQLTNYRAQLPQAK